MKTGTWALTQFKGKGEASIGELVAIQGSLDIPFEIKRVYYIVETPQGVVRGHHAHRNLEQVLIAVSGNCKIKVDDGRKQETFVLNDSRVGLRISNLVWREMMDFSTNCVLLVLASEYYDEGDYIRNYEQFKIEAQTNQNSRESVHE